MNDEEQSVFIKPCSKCGGKRIKSATQPALVLIRPLQSIKAFFSSTSNMSNIKVMVCTTCGYVAFYATEIDHIQIKETD